MVSFLVEEIDDNNNNAKQNKKRTRSVITKGWFLSGYIYNETHSILLKLIIKVKINSFFPFLIVFKIVDKRKEINHE